MKNFLLLVHLTKFEFKYDQWKAIFDADIASQRSFMRGTVTSKINDYSAIVSTEVFDKRTMDAFMTASAPRFADMGVKYEIYTLNHIHSD
jgi:hypothetical protein